MDASCVNVLFKSSLVIFFIKKGRRGRGVPYIRQNQRTLRYEVSLIKIVLGAHMRDAHWGDGMPPERLVDDSFDIRQFSPVGKGWKVIWSNDTVELFLCLFLDSWVQSHCEEEAGYGRDGLVLLVDYLLLLQGGHTVSTPPAYRDAVENFMTCSSFGVSWRPCASSSSLDKYEAGYVPCSIC